MDELKKVFNILLGKEKFKDFFVHMTCLKKAYGDKPISEIMKSESIMTQYKFLKNLKNIEVLDLLDPEIIKFNEGINKITRKQLVHRNRDSHGTQVKIINGIDSYIKKYQL